MHDPAQRRRAQRAGRERGCWVYIPAELLERLELELNGQPPDYRTWAGPRNSVLVNLYPPPSAAAELDRPAELELEPAAIAGAVARSAVG